MFYTDVYTNWHTFVACSPLSIPYQNIPKFLHPTWKNPSRKGRVVGEIIRFTIVKFAVVPPRRSRRGDGERKQRAKREGSLFQSVFSMANNLWTWKDLGILVGWVK
jgi:hypothetical protein